MVSIVSGLQEAIERNQLIKVCREDIDSQPLYGYPLSISEELCLFENYYDFHFEGYTIIRLEDISSIRSDENERFSEFIITEEGLKKKDIPPVIELMDWKTALKDLKNKEKYIIIESEAGDDFYIGRIEEIKEESVSFLYFDGLGVWDKEPFEILYSNITSVSFNQRYLNVISKYLKT
jgi:hypothetical protein